VGFPGIRTGGPHRLRQGPRMLVARFFCIWRQERMRATPEDDTAVVLPCTGLNRRLWVMEGRGSPHARAFRLAPRRCNGPRIPIVITRPLAYASLAGIQRLFRLDDHRIRSHGPPERQDRRKLVFCRIVVRPVFVCAAFAHFWCALSSSRPSER
jgi:hypothetical protein